MNNASWPVRFWYAAARVAGEFSRVLARVSPRIEPELKRSEPAGISVVIPSRNGRELLAAQLPGLAGQLKERPGEILIVDNGSDDGTAEWLASEWPGITVEVAPEPLSFAAAVNKGIARAQYSRVCLLNNDMLLEPGFFVALERVFERMPYLFCATAQIRFPEGVRREETGKAVMAQAAPDDFPVRCDEPQPGEDETYVLYGSGGCSLYDAAKLRALGGVDEAYAPAYVEDLDLGYRAWQRGWPTVFVAGAIVEHRHRATTSRYYTPSELDRILEKNYLRFLTRAVTDHGVFRRLWLEAIVRLRLKADRDPAAFAALRAAPLVALADAGRSRAALPPETEAMFLALGSGTATVFPGHPRTAKPLVLVVTESIREALDRVRHLGTDYDTVLVSLVEHPASVPPEMLSLNVETVLVSPSGQRDLVFRAAIRETSRKWEPSAASARPNNLLDNVEDRAPARNTVK